MMRLPVLSPGLCNPLADALRNGRRTAALGLALALGLCTLNLALAQPAVARSLPAVVVWDFDNQTAASAAPAERIEFLKRALSENLTAALLQVAGLPVVERQRMKDLLAEQRVSGSELADDDARLRLGRIVGAARMVFGGFFVLGDDVQVNVRVIDTATARVLFADETTAPFQAVMQQVEPLNRRLSQALGGSAASASRSYAVALWQDYDRALALADAGQLDSAVQALQALLARDKNFMPAERQLVALLDKMARR